MIDILLNPQLWLMGLLYFYLSWLMDTILPRTRLWRYRRGRCTLVVVFGITSLISGWYIWRFNLILPAYQCLVELAFLFLCAYPGQLKLFDFRRSGEKVLALITPEDKPLYWGYAVEFPYYIRAILRIIL